MARYALSFDIGGTFTDFALFEMESGRAVAYHKVLTDAREPARGVLRGWQELIAQYALVPSDVELAVHSTTLVTNALIERKGAVTGLLTTRGFRDSWRSASSNSTTSTISSRPYPCRSSRAGCAPRWTSGSP